MKVTTIKPKYELDVTILQGEHKLYDGIAKLDVVFAKIPTSGVFSLTLKHENKIGFARMFAHFATAKSKLGIKAIKPNVDFYECALTKQNIPDEVTIVFDNPHSARIMMYALSIPTIVDGGWRDASKDATVSYSRILHHSTESGFDNLISNGTSQGYKIATTKGVVTASMIEQFRESRTLLASSKVKPAKEEVKPLTKVKAKVKATAKTRKEKTVKPKLTAEQVAIIEQARELPDKKE